MQILTLDNETFSLNNLPEEVDENTRFAVLDNAVPSDPDFLFMPLIFLESLIHKLLKRKHFFVSFMLIN